MVLCSYFIVKVFMIKSYYSRFCTIATSRTTKIKRITKTCMYNFLYHVLIEKSEYGKN
ncbi:low temperature requirement protein LtrA [Chryseobacterium sp. H1D6B]|nr:low temperature requirement protein LtrA [Chryseobacterium sp. H1D6B]